jgi:hypothetical protein
MSSNLDGSVLEDDVLDDVEPDVGSPNCSGSFVPVEGKWGRFGDFQLVGNGSVTSEMCGKFRNFKGCIRTELHDRITLDGENFAGKAFVKVVSYSCDKPSCPVCFKSGWAVREAGRIEARLKEASKRFGLAEHIVASPPVRDYGLKFKCLRNKVVKVLAVRGVIGGVLIFHGFRYDVRRHWYWSPHFPVLGFILGGYGCRGCKRGGLDCRGCGGYEGRTRREFEKDGHIVKVLGKRKTVFGTAWYQLNHLTIRTNVKRPHACTWFGVCSYRRLKVRVEKRKSLCPICGEELVKLHYLGVRRIVKERGSPDYVGSFVDDLVDENGSPNWVEAPR